MGSLTSEQIARWHKRLYWFWVGPGVVISVVLAVFTSTLVVLIWNLVLSQYTIAMEHFLGRRQEKGENL